MAQFPLAASDVVGPTRQRAPGSGVLCFDKIRAKTVLTRAVASSPLRFLQPRNSGSAAWVYAATYGGGLVGGDTIDIDIAIQAGAHAFVSTQASTKIYRSARPTSQRLRADIADNGLLVLLPDPISPFAASRYSQEQQLTLSVDASLVAVDWMTAGRVRSGERWAFTSYAATTVLKRKNRVIWHDAMRLSPDDGEIAERMGRFNVLASSVAIGPAVGAAARRLVGAIGEAPVVTRANLLLSAAPLDDDGVLLRVAGTSAQQVSEVLRQHLNFIPPLLGDDPWATRW